MQSHRTRPPPADTRRACCHVLSSFQRTGLARPPATGLSAVVRRTFQTYQPANLVSSLNSGLPEIFEFARRRRSSCVAHPRPWNFRPLGGRRVASHAQLRGTEPGGFSNLKVGMRAVCVRRGLPFGHPCAPVTLRRARRIYGPVTVVSTGNRNKTERLLQATEAQGVGAELPALVRARSGLKPGDGRAGCGGAAPARTGSGATWPSSSP
jgi:hypothetical protein